MQYLLRLGRLGTGAAGSCSSAAWRPASKNRSARWKSRQLDGPKRGVTGRRRARRAVRSSPAGRRPSLRARCRAYASAASSVGSAAGLSPGHAASVCRLMMLTATVTSAPSSATASVGTGTSASPSTSRFPSCSCGGNIPASAVAASRASQSGPSVQGAGACAFRSTVIATNGMTRSSNVLLVGRLAEQARHRLEPGRAAGQRELEDLVDRLGP